MSAVLLVLLVDLVFVGASVYLVTAGDVLPGVVMMLMGMVATGLLVVRVVARGPGPRGRRTGVPLFDGPALRNEVVTLAPELEESVAAMAREDRIAAIKRVRELTGASLRTAKDYVEELARR